MFGRLFPSRKPQSAACDPLYAAIVAAARQPRFYADWEVPDTPLGRFEMIGLHMILVQRRLQGMGEPARALAQALMDEYFLEIEHSLRELGIGDAGVPRRMKTLGKMHFGRTASYAAALDAGDVDALAAALARNVRPGVEGWTGAVPLATYAMAAARALDGQPVETLLGGRLAFPAP